MPRQRLMGALILILAVLTRAGLAQTPVTYIYDQAGRLVGVVDPTGAAAAYKYDATGNILSITRYTSTQVAIITFTPSGGAAGSTVTIRGTGYSSIASQNTVKFNGTTASVISSTPTQIVTTVPPGATSGTINVTSPLGSATSVSPFTVGSAASAPFISSFTPNVDAWGGGTLTINGGNFSTVASNNRVKINVGFAPVTSATAGSLTVSVPAGATSGKITASTSAGTGVSSDDLFVAPPGQGLSGGSGDTRVSTDGTPGTINVAGGGWAGLAIFDANAGQKFSVEITTTGDCSFFSTAGARVSLIDPHGIYLTGAGCYGGGYIDATTAVEGGTYSLLMYTQSGNVTGTFKVYNVVDMFGSLVINGTSIPLNFTTPGQTGRLTINGSQNQQISIVSSNNSRCENWELDNPNGSYLAGWSACDPTDTFVQVLPTTGVYTLKVHIGDGTGTVSASLTSP